MTTTRIRALRVNTTLIGAAFVTLLGAAAKGDTIDVFSTGNGNETCGDADANWTVSSGGSGGQTFILNSNCAIGLAPGRLTPRVHRGSEQLIRILHRPRQ